MVDWLVPALFGGRIFYSGFDWFVPKGLLIVTIGPIAVTGGHRKQDQILLVKIAKYIVLGERQRSYLLWSPVILTIVHGRAGWLSPTGGNKILYHVSGIIRYDLGFLPRINRYCRYRFMLSSLYVHA